MLYKYHFQLGKKKKKKETTIPVEHKLQFCGIKLSSMHIFRLSISHNQVMCKKTERYKFTTVIVSLKVEKTAEKVLTFYLVMQSPIMDY
jgi:hypothetical protein